MRTRCHNRAEWNRRDIGSDRIERHCGDVDGFAARIEHPFRFRWQSFLARDASLGIFEREHQSLGRFAVRIEKVVMRRHQVNERASLEHVTGDRHEKCGADRNLLTSAMSHDASDVAQRLRGTALFGHPKRGHGNQEHRNHNGSDRSEKT